MYTLNYNMECAECYEIRENKAGNYMREEHLTREERGNLMGAKLLTLSFDIWAGF